MARPLRIAFKNAFYHVVSRGERKDLIFRTQFDKEVFLIKLEEAFLKYKFKIHSYVLMNNHYHFLIETPYANISQIFHHLNSSYTNWFKYKYQLTGSLFQGRFKAILVDKENYFFPLSAYIHLNPVRAGLCDYIEEYKWSSYRYLADSNEKPQWLFLDLINKNFSQSEYRDFCYNWLKKNEQVDKQTIYGKNLILGSNQFIDQVRKKFRSSTHISNNMDELNGFSHIILLTHREVEEAVLCSLKIEKGQLYSADRYKNINRKIMMYALKKYTPMTLTEIAEIFDLKAKSVSASIRKFIKDDKNDKKVTKMLEFIDITINKRFYSP